MLNKLHPLQIAILKARGIEQSEWEQFVFPQFRLSPGAQIPGLVQAVERLVLAVERQEPILVFGDYDADGIPATALLTRALRSLGLKVRPIIPQRADGYGLTPANLDRLQSAPERLIIAVDNGTTAQAEVALLLKNAQEVIVIDHHQPREEDLPQPPAIVVNPKLNPAETTAHELCACALAWKVMWELYTALGRSPEPLKWLLDLVALSTVADIVPLLHENRLLLQFGLKVLEKSRNLGLKALIEQSGLGHQANLTSYDLGFKLAPRLNAPSRMGHEQAGVQAEQHVSLSLLLSTDPAEATELAGYLTDQNSQRQSSVEQAVQEAVLAAQPYLDDAVLVLQGDWSCGIIGLIASKLSEQFKRPTIILCPEGKGSVRSGPGVHALHLLEPAEELLLRFGGHAGAAGLTLKPDCKIDQFRQLVKQGLSQTGLKLSQIQEERQYVADLELSLPEATLEAAEAIQGLAPFGAGFLPPLFKAEGKVSGVKKMGQSGQHLQFSLEAGACTRRGVAFNWQAPLPTVGQMYSLIYALKSDHWQGESRVSLEIKSISSMI